MSEAIDSNRVREIWNEIETDDPDISTGSLLQRTCDRYEQEKGISIDHGEVSTALHRTRPTTPTDEK